MLLIETMWNWKPHQNYFAYQFFSCNLPWDLFAFYFPQSTVTVVQHIICLYTSTQKHAREIFSLLIAKVNKNFVDFIKKTHCRNIDRHCIYFFQTMNLKEKNVRSVFIASANSAGFAFISTALWIGYRCNWKQYKEKAFNCSLYSLIESARAECV